MCFVGVWGDSNKLGGAIPKQAKMIPRDNFPGLQNLYHRFFNFGNGGNYFIFCCDDHEVNSWKTAITLSTKTVRLHVKQRLTIKTDFRIRLCGFHSKLILINNMSVLIHPCLFFWKSGSLTLCRAALNTVTNVSFTHMDLVSLLKLDKNDQIWSLTTVLQH